MPNYDTHGRDGRVLGASFGIVAFVFIYSYTQSTRMAAIAGLIIGLAGFIGPIIPDADHHNSIPRKMLGKFLLAAIPIGLLIAIQQHAGFRTFVGNMLTAVGVQDEIKAVAIIFVIGVVCAKVITGGIDILTGAHRTRTHNKLSIILLGPLFAAFAGMVVDVAGYSNGFAAFVSIGVALAVAFGILIHLSRDGEL